MSIAFNLDHSILQVLSSAAWEMANIQMFYDPAYYYRMFCFSAGRKAADQCAIIDSEVGVYYYVKDKQDHICARQLLSAKLPVLRWDLSADEEKTDMGSVTIPGASLSTSLRFTLLDGILNTIAEDTAEWDKMLADVKTALRVVQKLSGSDSALPELQVRQCIPSC
jgi:hypothetical protein